MIEVILLARVPFLERLAGFDKLTGLAPLDRPRGDLPRARARRLHRVGLCEAGQRQLLPGVLELAHAPAAEGSRLVQRRRAARRRPRLSINLGPPTTSPYPGIITATIGTFLLVVVLVTSLVIVRRKLSYEWWYAIHFTAYAGIALAWFHMIPDGNELIANVQRGRLLARAVLLRARDRGLVPPRLADHQHLPLRHPRDGGDPRGARTSCRCACRAAGLDRLGTKAGQFYFWRFFTKGFWYTQHPFSLSEAPKGDSFRITVKNLGDHSAKFGEIPVGTRVFAEGPFGVFTDESRTSDKALLIAGGIGITPVRALLEDMDGDVIALYRVVSSDDLVFADELDALSESRGAVVNYVVGDHASAEGRDLLSPAHLRELVPDIAERDVFICGPVGHDRQHRPQSAPRERPAAAPARRAIRPVSFCGCALQVPDRGVVLRRALRVDG